MTTRQALPYFKIMTLNLTDDEASALAKHLRQAIEHDLYPLALRLDPLKAILANLEPAARARNRCPRRRPDQ